MKLKKITAGLLVFLLIATLFTGCGKKEEPVIDEPQNEPEEKPITEIMPEVSPEEVKAFDDFLTEFASFNALADFENADLEGEYALSKVIVYGEPETEGFDIVSSVKDPYGYTYVQLSSKEEAKRFDEHQKELGKESYEDLILVAESTDSDSDTDTDSNANSNGFDTSTFAYGTSKHGTSVLNSWGTEYVGSSFYADVVRYKKRENTKIIVAVLDDGLNVNHTFYKDRLLPGYDFVENDKDVAGIPKYGHGTHVTGTIVDNTPGLNVKILPVRVIGHIKLIDGEEKEVGTVSEFVNGMRYAMNHGASVINLSLGFSLKGVPKGACKPMDDVVKEAVKKGITVCIAAGNEKTDTSKGCPSHLNLDGAIIVSSIGPSDEKSDFSNSGNNVDICAPGEAIYSCAYDGTYIAMRGTSMATPHVTAACAMVKLSHPEYTPAQVEKFLKKYVKDIGPVGKDEKFGEGLLQLFDCDRAETALIFAVEADPTKLEYAIGDELDLTGTKFFIKYIDETTKTLVVPSGYKYDATWKTFLKNMEIKVEPQVFKEAGQIDVKIKSFNHEHSLKVVVKDEPRLILPTLNNMFPATNSELDFAPVYVEEYRSFVDNEFIDYGVSYDSATNTLTLNNVKGGFILASAMGNGFKIKVVGKNTLNGIFTYSRAHSASLTITGDGSLDIVTHDYYGNQVYAQIFICADMSEGMLIVDENVDLFVQNGIDIRATMVEDSVIIKSPNRLVDGAYGIDGDPNGETAYDTWSVKQQMQYLNGNIPMMYHSYVVSPLGVRITRK